MNSFLPHDPPIDFLESLVEELRAATTLEEKLLLLNSKIHKEEKLPKKFINTIEKEIVYKSLMLIKQEEHLFYDAFLSSQNYEQLEQLFEQLWEIEDFYFPIGGIIGYHFTFLSLLSKKNQPPKVLHFEPPPGMDLSQEDRSVIKAIRAGIECMSQVGEIYPAAGAGDRLNLTDVLTGQPLPAALLNFLGYSLLEGLIRDLQAREFLHYKLLGKQIHTPVILMTSLEKENDTHIKEILNKNHWFHRSKELYFFILQPLVPMISIQGLWVTDAPFKIQFKPGGHGVIWKLAEDEGAFDWFLAHKCNKAIVRQINNPIAGVDNGLIALSGLGCSEDKSFGFATCPRLVGTAEGVDILIEKPTEKGYEYCITNIEYTEFENYNIKDVSYSSGSHYSQYPSNTNILFLDVNVLKKTLKNHPFPGLLLNLKLQLECFNEKRELHTIEVGRLESTMQNIADFIVTKSSKKLNQEEKKHLKSFVTYNRRGKTISATKKLFNNGKMEETPDQAFFDVQMNAYELFTQQCHFTFHKASKEAQQFIKNPPFIVTYHPALGPLYSVIAQKIQKGHLKEGAELRLEIAELYIQDLTLDGSLQIKALSPLGHLGSEGDLTYSNKMGKCYLKNIIVENSGINASAPNKFWKNEIFRKETLEIIIEEDGEFHAENIIFRGSHRIFVPKGHRMIAYMEDHRLSFKMMRLEQPSWYWLYTFDDKDHIVLSLQENP
ncbi:Uncharacterized protein PHSC3_000940 [Chlamydiales bacterium STE3]|nr:Uncharacterized protein PHSC3_000940 [Chlamydiales bacterium STE3]